MISLICGIQRIKQINKQNINRLIDIVNKLKLPDGKWLGGKVEKCKGNRKLQTSHKDVKNSTGNVVDHIVITMYGARWVLELSGGSLCKLYNCLITMLYN